MYQLSQNQQFTNLIIELNTQNQLFEKGIDSRGIKLSDIGGDYSAKTVEIKKEKGQPTDRVTLKDTGDFYNSFKIYFDGLDFNINADTIKDTTDLLREWGKDILGLTDESLDILIKKALEIIIPYIKNVL